MDNRPDRFDQRRLHQQVGRGGRAGGRRGGHGRGGDNGAPPAPPQARRARGARHLRGAVLRLGVRLRRHPALARAAAPPDARRRGRDVGSLVRGVARLAVHLLGHELVRSGGAGHPVAVVRRHAARPGDVGGAAGGVRRARAALRRGLRADAGRAHAVRAARARAGPRASPNFRRILFWVSVAAVFWVAGAFAEGGGRTLLWAVAVLCEYVSPMFGFPCPGSGGPARANGRSRAGTWPSAARRSCWWRWARRW